MRTILNSIDNIQERLGRAISWLLLIMILIGAFNAIVRYIDRFGGPSLSSNVYLELQWYLFSCVFLLGAAYTLKGDGHVRVDVFYGRLGTRGKAWVDLLGTLVFLIPFCLFAIIVSWPSVRNSWQLLEVSPDPGGLPRYPIKTLPPIAFTLLLLQGVVFALRNAYVLKTGNALDAPSGDSQEFSEAEREER